MQAIEPRRVRVGQLDRCRTVAQHRALSRDIHQDHDRARAAGPPHDNVDTDGGERISEGVARCIVAHLADEPRGAAREPGRGDHVGRTTATTPDDGGPGVTGDVDAFVQAHHHVLDQIAHRTQHGGDATPWRGERRNTWLLVACDPYPGADALSEER